MASIKRLRAEAATCTRCDLYRGATQTVFGEGRDRLVLIGEQPGDQEDIGVSRSWARPDISSIAPSTPPASSGAVYVTNAVKHFKWKRRGEGAAPPEAHRRGGACLRRLVGAELDALGPDLSCCWAPPPPRPCSARGP